jgi:hypothetical protein
MIKQYALFSTAVRAIARMLSNNQYDSFHITFEEKM